MGGYNFSLNSGGTRSGRQCIGSPSHAEDGKEGMERFCREHFLVVADGSTIKDMTLDQDALVALGRANLCPVQFPDVPSESVERRLAEYRCSPRYPEVVAHNLMLAREVCVAGSLFYELFTVGRRMSQLRYSPSNDDDMREP
jgi:hypothetical protein